MRFLGNVNWGRWADSAHFISKKNYTTDFDVANAIGFLSLRTLTRYKGKKKKCVKGAKQVRKSHPVDKKLQAFIGYLSFVN